MLGAAAVAMWWDVAPEAQAEFEDWHSHEHMPERLRIPGFLRGSRWIAASGARSYFVLYEADSLATLTGSAYLERLNNPTPWSRKMMPQHLNIVRGVCRVRAGIGGGLAQTMATVRIGHGPSPVLPRGEGLTGAFHLETQPQAGKPRTAEQQIRGGVDQEPQGIVLVNGHDAEAVSAAARTLGSNAGLYRLSYCLTPNDQWRGP